MELAIFFCGRAGEWLIAVGGDGRGGHVGKALLFCDRRCWRVKCMLSAGVGIALDWSLEKR